VEKKFVIGLTGNIGTGKSVVRRMLERKGALGIDADALVHRALLKGHAPHQAVLSRFGEAILQKDGEIDRRKLATLVFNDQPALAELERILHPAVETAVERILADSPLPIIVVEAIKLLESSLAQNCDRIWLVETSQSTQLERTLRSRKMSRAQVLERIRQQSPAEIKRRSAHVIIINEAGLEHTWQQVEHAWEELTKVNQGFAKAEKVIRVERKQNSYFLAVEPGDLNMIKDSVDPRRLIYQSPHWSIPTSSSTKSNYKDLSTGLFAQMCDFQFVLTREEIHSPSLVILRSEDFLLQTEAIFNSPVSRLTEEFAHCLHAVDLFARQRLCESIIFMLLQKADHVGDLLLEHGYQRIEKDHSNFKLWQTQDFNSPPAGYNVFVKSIRKTIVFE